MNNQANSRFVLVDDALINELKEGQEKILSLIQSFDKQKPQNTNTSSYITAAEFMEQIKVCRSKFDSLVANNTIATIKKGRKIYVLSTEVQRYFSDPTIK